MQGARAPDVARAVTIFRARQRLANSNQCTLSGVPGLLPAHPVAASFAPRWAPRRAQNIELAVCIASGIKRGVVDAVEQQRYDLPSATLMSDFTLVGLGQLIAAIEGADRYIEFPA